MSASATSSARSRSSGSDREGRGLGRGIETASPVAATFRTAVTVHAADSAPLDDVPDAPRRGAVDHLAAEFLAHLVGRVHLVQDDVLHDGVRAVDDDLAVDHRPHVHDQAVLLDQARIAANDAGVVDVSLASDDTRCRTLVTARVVFAVGPPAVTDGVPKGAALRLSRFRDHARQPEDEQGPVERRVQMLHCYAPLPIYVLP